MVSKHKGRSFGFRDRFVPEKSWQTPLRSMAARNGYVSSVSETHVWTRWRCRRCCSNISAGLQGKHKQAVFAKSKGMVFRIIFFEWWRREKPRDQEEEIEKLCAQVEQLRKLQRVEKGHGAQGDSTKRESGLEEDLNIF